MRLIGAGAVLHALHCTVVTKRELSRKTFLHRVAGVSLRDGEKLSHPGGTRGRAAAPLCGKEPVEVVQASDEDAARAPS